MSWCPMTLGEGLWIFLHHGMSDMHIMNNFFYVIFLAVIWLQSVRVLGSFDDWNQGEHLSPEYTGSLTTFSTTLMLKPGRYCQATMYIIEL